MSDPLTKWLVIGTLVIAFAVAELLLGPVLDLGTRPVDRVCRRLPRSVQNRVDMMRVTQNRRLTDRTPARWQERSRTIACLHPPNPPRPSEAFRSLPKEKKLFYHPKNRKAGGKRPPSTLDPVASPHSITLVGVRDTDLFTLVFTLVQRKTPINNVNFHTCTLVLPQEGYIALPPPPNRNPNRNPNPGSSAASATSCSRLSLCGLRSLRFRISVFGSPPSCLPTSLFRKWVKKR